MSQETPCPDSDELRQLIEGSLSGDRVAACTQHMDSCGCCQSRLENLATGGSNLSDIVKHLDAEAPMATSVYWPALQAAQTGILPTAAPQAGAAAAAPAAPAIVRPIAPRTRNVSLTFLQPATDSAYLGRLAHFDVMRVLGRGGMGLVLEAFDSRLHRNVALKVLDPDLVGDETSRARFCREARAAASITHENVVAVHQVEKAGDDALPYLVMQLITGESLDERLAREKKLPLREVVRIGMQAAHGLAAAHAQGLIHRDIKPANIMLESPNDNVKLTDFGLARAAEDVKLTHTGFVPGTPLYMAPEQAMGESTDQRSDLFSLGAVLYEMCAGQPPFPGNSSLVILKQIVENKHRPLRELNPAVPDWLAHTVDRLLAKKPADRIETAEQLAELFDFEWALMKASSEEVPAVCQIEARRRARRNMGIAAAIGAGFLALGLLAGIFLFDRPSGPPTPVSSAEPVAVLSANDGVVWSACFDPASDTLAMGVESGKLRLWDLGTKSIKATIDAHRGVIWRSKFSPDHEYLATSGDDGFIKLWKTSQPEPIRSFKHGNAVRGLAISPDGQKLYGGDREGGLRIWSPDADEPILQTQQPGAVYTVAISPSGDTLATGGSDKVVRLWNADSLTQKLPLEGHTGPVYNVAFKPDGKRLASVGWDKTVRVWDAASGSLINSWHGHDSDIWGVAFSPDGKRIATGGTDGAAKLWDAETGKLLATFLGHNSGIHTLAFHKDGTRLATGGRDGAVRIWQIDELAAGGDAMDYVRLGSTGLKVSRLCLGTMTYGAKSWREWVLDEEEGRPFIRRALELGINFFDTADMYSLGVSEEILGRALRDFGPKRDQVVIGTKVFNAMSDEVNDRGLSRQHIMHSIDASLRRLGTDYVDLYQIHRFDYDTPIEETLQALDDVVRAGKALYIGASSMFAWQFAKMQFTADRLGLTRFVTMQNHYNLVYREEEREMIPLCRDQRVGLIPWSPLARGFLAGNRRKEDFGETLRAKTDDYGHKLYYRDSDFKVVERVTQIAHTRGISNAQVALAWLLAQPGVTAPIIGASKMQHLDDAVAALGVKLDESELKALADPYEVHSVLGHS